MSVFLAVNWLWIAFTVAVLGLHRRGGCAMHGNHPHPSPEPDTEKAHHHSGGRRSMS